MKDLTTLCLLGGFGLAGAMPYKAHDVRSTSPNFLGADIFLRDLNELVPRVGHRDNIATLPERNLTRRAPDAPPGTVFQNLPNGWTWDREMLNDARKEKVADAWNTAKHMLERVSASFGGWVDEFSTQNQLDAQLGVEAKRLEIRKAIAQAQPAYTQLFSADVDHMHTIVDNLKKILDNIENVNAKDRNKGQIYLTALSDPHELGGSAICAGTGQTTATQAFVIKADKLKELVDFKKSNPDAVGLPPDDADIMNFCDAFFEMPQASSLFKDLGANRKGKDEVCSTHNQDTTARVLLHEWSHFTWTINTNPLGSSGELGKDITGLDNVASRAYTGSKGKKDLQKPRFSDYTSQNADTYAWFVVYDFLNHASECAGQEWDGAANFKAGCTDTWTKGKEKWTKNTWDKMYTGKT